MLIQQNKFYSCRTPHPPAGCILGASVAGVVFLYTRRLHYWSGIIFRDKCFVTAYDCNYDGPLLQKSSEKYY